MVRNLLQNNKIFIAGHRGMVGSALVRYLKKKNFKNFILVSRKQINLLDEDKVDKFIKKKNLKLSLIALEKSVEYWQTLNIQ